jgi:hypothetical protein
VPSYNEKSNLVKLYTLLLQLIFLRAVSNRQVNYTNAMEKQVERVITKTETAGTKAKDQRSKIGAKQSKQMSET